MPLTADDVQGRRKVGAFHPPRAGVVDRRTPLHDYLSGNVGFTGGKPAASDPIPQSLYQRARAAGLSDQEIRSRWQERGSGVTSAPAGQRAQPSNVRYTPAQQATNERQGRQAALGAAIDRTLGPKTQLGVDVLGAAKVGSGLVRRFGSQWGDMLRGAVPGLIDLGRLEGSALKHDVSTAIHDPGGKQSLHDFIHGNSPASRQLGQIPGRMAHQVREDFTHPSANVGYLSSDLLALLSGGAAVGERATAATRAARAGAGVKETAATLLRRPAPETFGLTARGPAGPVTVGKPLLTNPLVKPLQRAYYRSVERKLNEPGRRPLSERLTAPKVEGGYELPGAAAAVVRPLVRLQEQTVGPEAVFRRGLGAQRRTERASLGAPAEDLRAAASTRVPHLFDNALPDRFRRGLSPEEDKALQAVSILGREAIVNPEASVHLLRGYHSRSAALAHAAGVDAESELGALRGVAEQLYREGRYDELAQVETRVAELEGEIRSHAQLAERHMLEHGRFQATLPVLKAAAEGRASSVFNDVLPKVAALAEERKKLIAHHLPEDAGAFREAAPAAVYRAGPDEPHPLHEQVPVLATRAENPEARALNAQLAELDKQIGKVHEQFRRSAKRLRPVTVTEARTELQTLEREHEAFLKRQTERLMSRQVTTEEAQRLLSEHDAKIEQAKQDVQAAAVSELPVNRLHHGQAATELDRAAKVTVATRRLKKLERERARFVEATKTGRLRQLHDPSETASRNLSRAKGINIPTLAQELRQELERSLEETLARHPDEPALMPIRDRITRLERLREGLAKHNELADPLLGKGGTLTAEELAQHFGTKPVGVDETHASRLGTLNEYRDVLQGKLDKALAREPKLHTLLDETMLRRRELPPVEGAFRTPLGTLEGPGFASPYAAPAVGKHGIPPTDARRRDASLGHEFTGGEIKHADLTHHVVDAMVTSYLKATGVVSRENEYARYWRLAAPVRTTDDQVPIREPRLIPDEFKAELRRIAERPEAHGSLGELDRDVTDTLDRYLRGDELSSMERKLLAARGLPEGLWRRDRLGRKHVAVPIGTDLSDLGIRWVKRDFLQPVRQQRPRSYAMAGVDFLNDLGRLGVYARGAYGASNLLSNFAMQALDQGYLAAPMYRRAWKLRDDAVRQLGPEAGDRLAAQIEAQVGEGRARSYNVDHGGLGKVTGTLASIWSDLIDRPSRVSAFLYWAHRHGVNISDMHELQKLLDEGGSKLVDVRERANKSMVQFDNLTPLERDVVRHAVYFYPWVSRATAWAFRTVLEHPLKTFTVGQLARIAQDNQEREFGKLPSYLARRGYYAFKIGGKTYMIGAGPINPAQTAVDTVAQLVSPFDPSQPGLEEAASPAVQYGLEMLTGRDTQDHKLKGNRFKAAALDTVIGTPQGQALRRGLFGKRVARALGARTDYSRMAPDQRPVFPGSSFLEGAGPLAAGSLSPRGADLEAAHAKQRKEWLDSLPPVQRAQVRSQDEVQSLLTVARHAGLAPEDSPELMRALHVSVQRDVAYAQEAHDLKVPTRLLRQADRLRVDLQLLTKMGVLDDQAANDAYDQYKGAGDAAIKNLRRELSHDYFQLGIIKELRKELTEAGYSLKGGSPATSTAKGAHVG